MVNEMLPIFSSTKTPEILAITSIACGLITLGKKGTMVPATILNAMIELHSQNPDIMKCICMRLMGLGVALCYFGARDDIDVPLETMEVNCSNSLRSLCFNKIDSRVFLSRSKAPFKPCCVCAHTREQGTFW